jgi:glycerate-2-kinase
MAVAACRVLGDRVRQGLIVGVLPAGTSTPDGLPLPMIVGGHPTPTRDSERGGRAALAVAASLQQDEALVVLLSGERRR